MTLYGWPGFHEEPLGGCGGGGGPRCEVLDGRPGDLLSWREEPASPAAETERRR